MPFAGLFLVHLLYFSFLFATRIGLRFALQSVAISCALAARGVRGTKPVWLIDNDIPAINVGYTYFAFDITADRFERYLDEARVVPRIEKPDSRCAGPLDHYPAGSDVPFKSSPRPEASHLWVACVVARQGADLRFRVDAGRMLFGRITNEGVCEADLLQASQQACFRITPGGESRLCLRDFPSRREGAPGAAGHVTIEGSAAEVSFREAPAGALREDAHELGSQR